MKFKFLFIIICFSFMLNNNLYESNKQIHQVLYKKVIHKPLYVNHYKVKKLQTRGTYNYKVYYDINLSHEQQDWIRYITKLNGFSFELGIALCYVESDFNNLNENSCGAIGYYQVLSSTAEFMLSYMNTNDNIQYQEAIKGFGLYDFKSNCRISFYLLKYLLKESNGDIQIALSKYNGQNDYSYYSRLIIYNCNRLRNKLPLTRTIE